jgi:hypothetical protein
MSPSPGKERGIKGVRLTKNLILTPAAGRITIVHA